MGTPTYNTYTAPYIYRGEYGERAPFSIKEIIIHKDVTTIRDSAFIGRRFLTRVTMHNHVTTIGKYAFSGCTSLQPPFALSKNLEYIGKFAFNRCHSLEALFLPPSVAWVGSKAFRDCGSLRICHIPDTLDFVHGGAFDLCYRILTTNVQYIWDDESESRECTNNHDVNTWLRSRHDECPLHKICYNVNVTADKIHEFIHKHSHTHTHGKYPHRAPSISIDDQQMTAMHVVAANPHASPSAMRACFEANPRAVSAKDRYGCTPIHYLCKYNASILGEMHWLRVREANGCFDIGCDVTHVTPLHILVENGHVGQLPLIVAIRHHILWLDPIVEANLKRDGQILMRKDAETGLYIFMVAAVGEKADLSSIYKLLCINPGLVMAL